MEPVTVELLSLPGEIEGVTNRMEQIRSEVVRSVGIPKGLVESVRTKSRKSLFEGWR